MFFNPASQYLEVPYWAMDEFMYLLTYNDKQFQISYNYGRPRVQTNCVQYMLPTIYLRLEKHYIEIQPEDYVQKNKFHECKLMITTANYDHWVFGSSVLKKYYTTFKQNDDRFDELTIVPALERGSTQKENLDPHSGWKVAYNPYCHDCTMSVPKKTVDPTTEAIQEVIDTVPYEEMTVD